MDIKPLQLYLFSLIIKESIEKTVLLHVKQFIIRFLKQSPLYNHNFNR